MRAYVPFYLAINYILFAFATALGALQVAGLASGDCRMSVFVSPNHPRIGLVAAGGWIAAAYAAYWLFAPELLTPGPAGAELTAMFGFSALLALGFTRLLTRLRPMTNDERPTTNDQPATSNHPPSAIRHPPFIVALLFSILVGVYDLPLFRALNGLAGRYSRLDSAIQFLMNDYIVPTGLVLTLLALWFAGRFSDERTANQVTVLRALLALAGTNLVLKLINLAYFRPRPFTNYEVTLLFYHPSDSSFPSNAAGVGFALAVAVWLRCERWGAWMLGLAGAMGLARVCGGVHFPLDIIAGAWLGGLSAWAVDRAVCLDRLLERVIGLARRLTLG